ncbi:MAG: ABC transporter permease [Verrucomicrobiae bacterium]|nr:ABC transporter permease [Verrucomicrobiae bacterium]
MLEVREQVRLSLRRMLSICMDSLSHRLLRSVVTVGIIVLAIAFLGQILFDGYFGRAVRDEVNVEVVRATAYTRFLRKAGVIEAPEQLVRAASLLHPGTADFRNLGRRAGFSPEETQAFVEDCRRVDAFVRFFDSLPGGRRALLAGEATAFEVLDRLQREGDRRNFFDRLTHMKSLDLPGGTAGIEALSRDWPVFRARLARVEEGTRKSVKAIAALCGANGLRGALGAAVRDGRDAVFFRELEKAGLEVALEEARRIVVGWRHEDELAWATAFLKDSRLRAAWYLKYQRSLNPSETLAECARSPSRLDWLEKQVARRGNAAFDAARFHRVACDYRARTELLDARERLANRYGDSDRFSEKTLWLIVVSLLVCIVGITNAMLMSVLERFKEIATMKCLGARNQTIAFIFVIESAAMGVAGGILGMLIGAAIAFGRQLLASGGRLLSHFPLADALTAAGICLACSVFLAAIAAIYPAGIASRMAPMEAMRVD